MIRRALASKVKNVRVPAYMVELLDKWRKTGAQLAQKLGHAPPPEEIARSLGLPAERLTILRRAMGAQTPSPRGHETDFVQDLPDKAAPAPGATDSTFDSTDARPVDRLLPTVLSEREELIVNLRFGLNPEAETHTLEAIGRSMGLTRERVRQIEAQALRKLFAFLTGEEGEPPRPPKKKRASPGRSKKKTRKRPGKRKG